METAQHVISPQGKDQQAAWQERVRHQLEAELERRVRDALETPPLERLERRRTSLSSQLAADHSSFNHDDLNAHLDLAAKEREYRQKRRRRARMLLASLADNRGQSENSQRNSPSGNGPPNMANAQQVTESIQLVNLGEPDYFTNYNPGSVVTPCWTASNGNTDDKGIYCMGEDGLMWPSSCPLLLPAPAFIEPTPQKPEPLYSSKEGPQLFDSQATPYTQKWRGMSVVFDSERSAKQQEPVVTAGPLVAPSLIFESRFECGNLRQARRVGQFEYELLLKTDLYTRRHTQWYYFRVQNAVPGIIYKFRIVNFLKKDSLYNYGMRPLFYSELDARRKKVGWIRKGHHIRYSQNTQHLSSILLSRDMMYYELEWQLEFSNANDTCYMAHCYPYTFSDLKRDLDALMADPSRAASLKREVMCVTQAGNSCFLVTVTDFEFQSPKKCVVVSARVHPGESNSSWMMKGLLDYITSSEATAKELRRKFVFKIVPMLNPDGVIIGNYRCDLTGKDLNRNYRWPGKDSVPTVAYTKAMIEQLQNSMEVLVYCDLHGHSRQSNVFMYGCNSPESIAGDARAFLDERLFPYLVSRQAPDMFSFPSCKFKIQKRKESTGRVVMYRQMKIKNSFTLESTFSGTVLDRNGSRHFNQSDYQEIGKFFCFGLHEYSQVLDDKQKKTEAVLDLTKELTHQILKRRSHEAQIATASNVESVADADSNEKESAWNHKGETQTLVEQEGNEARTEDDQMEPGAPDLQKTSGAAGGQTISGKIVPESELPRQVFLSRASYLTACTEGNLVDEASAGAVASAAQMHQTTMISARAASRGQVILALDSASEEAIKACARLLDKLGNCLDSLEHESSSDSDSESEADVLTFKEKIRKKNKKPAKKKRREKALYTVKKTKSLSELATRHRMPLVQASSRMQLAGSASATRTAKPASVLPPGMAVLPSIPKQTSQDSNVDSNADEQEQQHQQQQRHEDKNERTAKSPVKYTKVSRAYQWVNPFAGRTNGGIPCFSEKRSEQRAARRVRTMRSRQSERLEGLSHEKQTHDHFPLAESDADQYDVDELLLRLQLERSHAAEVAAASDSREPARLTSAAADASRLPIPHLVTSLRHAQSVGGEYGHDSFASHYERASREFRPVARGDSSHQTGASGQRDHQVDSVPFRLSWPALPLRTPTVARSDSGLASQNQPKCTNQCRIEMEGHQPPEVRASNFDLERLARASENGYIFAMSSEHHVTCGTCRVRKSNALSLAAPADARQVPPSGYDLTAAETPANDRQMSVPLPIALTLLPDELCANDVQLMSRKYVEILNHRLRQQQQQMGAAGSGFNVNERSVYLGELLRVNSLSIPPTDMSYK